MKKEEYKSICKTCKYNCGVCEYDGDIEYFICGSPRIYGGEMLFISTIITACSDYEYGPFISKMRIASKKRKKCERKE